MIWSLTPFFNEVEVFGWRLQELHGVVDRHVVVEATTDHRGNKKTRNFPMEWVHRDDVDYRFVHLETRTDWHREQEQRRRLDTPGIAPDDVVLLSDADEIPRASDLRWVAETASETPRIMKLAMHVYRPQWRWKDELEPWFQICRVFKGSLLEKHNLEEIRQMGVNESAYGGWPGLGWHLAYMGGPEMIRQKLGAIAEREYEHGAKNAVRAYETGVDLFGRNHVVEEVPKEERPGWMP
jgi:Glycosyltransferase family 17